MALKSHFALNTVFWVESLSVDALVLRHDCPKIDGDSHVVYCQRQKCSPRSVVSGNIRLMPIFVGVRWWGGVKWECGRRKCEFSLSIAMKFTTGFPYRNLHGLSRFPGDSRPTAHLYSCVSRDMFLRIEYHTESTHSIAWTKESLINIIACANYLGLHGLNHVLPVCGPLNALRSRGHGTNFALPEFIDVLSLLTA